MRETLKHYIEEQLRQQGDEVDFDFDDDLVMSGIDSLGFLRLIDFIEHEYGVRVPPGEVTIEHFGTIESIAVYLERLQTS